MGKISTNSRSVIETIATDPFSLEELAGVCVCVNLEEFEKLRYF